MSLLPHIPDDVESYSSTAELSLRYEDVCQDGRLMPLMLPSAIGMLWQQTSDDVAIDVLMRQGVVPILSQLWVSCSDEIIHPHKGARCRGKAALAHTRNEEGEVGRILLDLRAEVYGTRGRMIGAVNREGEEVLGGTIFARYIFTRPFAPKGQRRVTSLEAEGVPPVPGWKAREIPYEAMLAIPEDAAAVEIADSDRYVLPRFSLAHCDSNQHVNSLVYPRLFEHEAQSHLLDAGKKPGLCRDLAIQFRKPFFAGDQPELSLRLSSANLSENNGAGAGQHSFAYGDFCKAGDQQPKPYAQIAMRFS